MTQNMKVLTWVFVIIVLAIGLVIFAYFYFFVGITSKAKYEKCCKTCEEIMFNESNIPACKLECENVADYSPDEQSTNTSPETTTNTSSSKDQEDITYYCEWSWPQKIINKNTKEVIQSCTNSRPYCNKEASYEKVGCCSSSSYSNCTLLSEMD